MAKLIFNAADVRRVVEHSLLNKQQRYTFAFGLDGKAVTRAVKSPAVILVHDDGVYLMSNGTPRDIVEGPSPTQVSPLGLPVTPGRSFVAYAHGTEPDAPGAWETARALVGGDDFSETLQWAMQIKEVLDTGVDTITIDYSSRGISLKLPPRKLDTDERVANIKRKMQRGKVMAIRIDSGKLCAFKDNVRANDLDGPYHRGAAAGSTLRMHLEGVYKVRILNGLSDAEIAKSLS